uniref:Uncharacterized protein n=1 Tax=Timema monikensis TaxID=170555 RepID=A0A7R9EN89_9NEOP|nr:unnamed protein product [Timema monikensis]
MELHDSISTRLRLLENMGLSSTNSMFTFFEEDICSYSTYSNSINLTSSAGTGLA